MENKTLGRGLSAFLDLQLENNGENVMKISVSEISPNPYQPRQNFDDNQLQSLAASIKRKGVLQPILVQKLSNNSYQLVAGERRLRASKIAGLTEIPAIVSEISSEDQLEIAILENVQRENLNPIEEAEGYKRLIDEFHRTQEELSEIIGKSRSHISNIMRLLTLPNEVQNAIKEGKLSFGHARALVTSDNVLQLAKEVMDKSLNVRETEDLVRKGKGKGLNLKPSYIDPEIYNLSHQITELIGLETIIKLKGKGGKIEMTFSDFNELDSFVQKINN